MESEPENSRPHLDSNTESDDSDFVSVNQSKRFTVSPNTTSKVRMSICADYAPRSIYTIYFSLIIYYLQKHKTSAKPTFCCPKDGCNSKHSRKDNLKRHLKKVHGIIEDDKTTPRFVCQVSACEKAFFHAKRLVEHYNQQHSIHIGMCVKVMFHHVHILCKYDNSMLFYIDTETKEFPSMDVFLNWKASEEEASHACFVQPKGETKSSSEMQESGIISY